LGKHSKTDHFNTLLQHSGRVNPQTSLNVHRRPQNALSNSISWKSQEFSRSSSSRSLSLLTPRHLKYSMLTQREKKKIIAIFRVLSLSWLPWLLLYIKLAFRRFWMQFITMKAEKGLMLSGRVLILFSFSSRRIMLCYNKPSRFSMITT